MTKVGWLWAVGPLFVSVSVLSSCSAQAPKPSKPVASASASAVTPAPSEIHERIALHTCTARARIAKVLGQEATTAPAEGPLDPSKGLGGSAPPPTTSLAGSTKLAEAETYRAVAPGTVLIRTGNGFGSGVVIDPGGYVLTNYHVVSNGRKKEFVVSVDVDLGELTPSGRMTRKEKTYEGTVVKIDPIRDVAIVKIEDPPAKLTSVKLAKSAPQVGEKVIAVGHAGVGFLWAAKSCGIASIGERQRDSSRLAGFECGSMDPSLTPEQAEREKKRCDERKKQMTEALEAVTQGLALQTDCAITHGDSGGPLVNMAGELVGLNQSVSADLATASFHVHLDELREFVSAYPQQGMPLLPDPLCDGGDNATLEDIDLDGVADTLMTRTATGVFSAYGKHSLLIDLDQDYVARPDAPDAPFEAELALLVNEDGTYVWYDTDGDTRFDVLLSDDDKDGTPEHAYRLEADGRVTEDKEKLPKHDFSGKFVRDPAQQARLGKIAKAIGGYRYVSDKTLATASGAMTIPDPLLGAGTQGRLVDTDFNGSPDAAFMRGTFSGGILIDADEDSLGSLEPNSPADEVVKAKKVDAEAVIISQADNVWALYDTNDDAKFDLALATSSGSEPTSLWVTGAWRLGPSNEMTAAPDQLGRKLLRPSLVGKPRLASAMRLLRADLAEDEGLGSLPNPRAGTRFRVREVSGAPKGPMVVESSSYPWRITLVDVDGDTKLPSSSNTPTTLPWAKPKTPAKPTPAALVDFQQVVAEGKFDAEIAVVHDFPSLLDWIFYDTDLDGVFDRVLFVPDATQPTSAYRRASSGSELVYDESAVAGPPIRYKNFNDPALGKKWKELASKMFDASLIEE